jgi:hypothetical protein
MNYSSSERQPIPLRPDRGALARDALRSVARACLLAVRSAGKNATERNPWAADRAVSILLTTRSAVSPTKTSDFAALSQVETNFLPSLLPASAAAAVLGQALQLSFDGIASINVPSVVIPSAAFVGEGQPIPVLQGTATALTALMPSKLASLIALTREMVDGANGEAIMTQLLKESVAASLDAAFFSANAATGISPAGILNGVAPIAASPAGQNPMVSDLANLAEALAPVSGSGHMIIIAAAKQTTAIKGLLIDPPPVYASNALPAGTVIGIIAESIAGAVGAPSVAASIETTIHAASPAAELVSSPGAVAAPQRSIFQTDSLALRLIQDCGWIRRGNGVQWIQNCNWP